jgi:TRAP-type C4-dicarboxylate transport system permease small subunit
VERSLQSGAARMTEEHGAGSTDGAASGAGQGAPDTPPRAEPAAPVGAPWGKPIVALDGIWTRFEIWLAMVAFALEVFSMSLWVCLKGFSAPADQSASVVFRGVFGAAVLGTIAHLALAKQKPAVRQGATVLAVVLGMVSARAWQSLGVEYASNLLNWYQQASTLTLFGGLRGVGTRLTMLLALVGGSLATARGRHIVIDVATRLVVPRARKAMVLVGWAASALVCMTAAWGFFDHISIENFGAGADDGAGKKVGQVVTQLGEDFFIARKQVELDVMATSHVVFKGEAYSNWLTGREWNAWVDSAGFLERYGKEAAEGLKIPVDEARAPLVVLPGRGEPRGELINAAYLVFPIGLLVIALRFILRGLLVMSGHANVESDESEDWNEHAARPGEEPVHAPD